MAVDKPAQALPERLAKTLAAAAPEAALHDAPAALPTEGGAYVLVIHLESAVRPGLARFPGLELAPGWYVYCGSAYGPGGLRARLARYMKRGKALRWHVDRLTGAATHVLALPVINGSECALFAALAGRPGFHVPAPGFGSSDCRSCESHLLYWAG